MSIQLSSFTIVPSCRSGSHHQPTGTIWCSATTLSFGWVRVHYALFSVPMTKMSLHGYTVVQHIF